MNPNYPMGVSDQDIDNLAAYRAVKVDDDGWCRCIHCQQWVISEVTARKTENGWIHDLCIEERTEKAADAMYAFVAMFVCFPAVLGVLAVVTR